jgi:hypothetical protein
MVRVFFYDMQGLKYAFVEKFEIYLNILLKKFLFINYTILCWCQHCCDNWTLINSMKRELTGRDRERGAELALPALVYTYKYVYNLTIKYQE